MRVLFVCTGNICRSPTAEGLFLHKAGIRGLGDLVTADSAGTSSEETGNPPDARARAAAHRRGFALPDRRARRVRTGDFAGFDLLLGMTRAHERILRRSAPVPHRDKVGLLLDYAAEVGIEEVPDPWYGDALAFEHALDLIEAGVDGLLDHIAAGAGRSGSSDA